MVCGLHGNPILAPSIGVAKNVADRVAVGEEEEEDIYINIFTQVFPSHSQLFYSSSSPTAGNMATHVCSHISN